MDTTPFDVLKLITDLYLKNKLPKEFYTDPDLTEISLSKCWDKEDEYQIIFIFENSYDGNDCQYKSVDEAIKILKDNGFDL